MKFLIVSSLLALQVGSPVRVATPNAPSEAEEIAHIQQMQLRRAQATSAASANQSSAFPERFSSRSTSPTLISSTSVSSLKDARASFERRAASALSMGLTSYLDVTPGRYTYPGCEETAVHPSGIERTGDGALNGYAAFFQCDGYWFVLRLSDYTQPTTQSMSTILADSAVAIRGGHMNLSYAATEDRRVRVSGTAVGQAVSADILVESSSPIEQTSAEAVARSVFEQVLVNPPPVRPQQQGLK